jgi:cytochrome d ubiquinol oxidase subunit II
MQTDQWRNFWEWAATIGSFCAAFLFGMMFTSMIQGVPMDSQGNIFGTFTTYVNWFSLVGGVAVSLLCFIHGLNFIRLKTSGELRDRAQKWSKVLYPVLLAGEVVFVILLMMYTDFFSRKPISTWSILVALVIFTLAAWWGAQARHDWVSFISSGLSLISVVVLIFNGLFPRVMIATTNAKSILIKDASSSPYTLHLMTILTFSILPIVLIYFVWSYWVFYKRLKSPAAAKE